MMGNSNNETIFPHKLLSINKQVTSICKASLQIIYQLIDCISIIKVFGTIRINSSSISSRCGKS